MFIGSAREYVYRLFSFHCGRTKKPYWINKTPGLLRYLCRFQSSFPSRGLSTSFGMEGTSPVPT